MSTSKAAAIGLETVGCCTILSGILLEIITGADIGYILITGGSMLVAIGGMLFAKLTRKK